MGKKGRAAKDHGRQQKNEIQKWENWIKELKTNPDILTKNRAGKLQVTRHHCRLLDSILQSKKFRNLGFGAKLARWEVLIPEFGKEVALAYRHAARSCWRIHDPGLQSERNEADPRSCKHLLAIAGLEIEFIENSDFPSTLFPTDAAHASRYFTCERDGFPGWLQSLHQAHPLIVGSAIQKELDWDLSSNAQHYVLSKIAYHAHWLHENIAITPMVWLQQNTSPSYERLQSCVRIILNSNQRKPLLELVKSRVSDPPSGSLHAAWHALWAHLDPNMGIPATDKWLSILPSDVVPEQAQLFASRLLGEPHHAGIIPDPLSTFEPAHLHSLHLLLFRLFHPKDDIKRSGRNAYSPEPRDYAQSAREKLLRQLIFHRKVKTTGFSRLALAAILPSLLRRWPWNTITEAIQFTRSSITSCG